MTGYSNDFLMMMLLENGVHRTGTLDYIDVETSSLYLLVQCTVVETHDETNYGFSIFLDTLGDTCPLKPYSISLLK